MRNIAHFTTLIPVGLQEQLETLHSWYLAHGTPIYTVNHSREHFAIKGELPEWLIPVEVRFTQRFGRDYVPLTAMHSAIRRCISADTERVIIANSDIGLATPEMVYTLEKPDCDLLFASRLDIDRQGNLATTYRKGYDVFSLSPDALSCLNLPDLYLGMPWWDYVLPLWALLEGRSVRRLDTEAFPHIIHAQRWSEVAFSYFGWQVMQRALPAEMLVGSASDLRVLEFAKVTNAFLNSDLLLKTTSDTNTLRALFLQQAGANDIVCGTNEAPRRGQQAGTTEEMLDAFIKVHKTLFSFFEGASAHRDEEHFHTYMEKALENAEGDVASHLQSAIQRYKELLSLRLSETTVVDSDARQ